MALTLIDPVNNRFKLDRSAVDRRMVAGHLETVLNSFANKPEYSKFYIGITGDLQERLARHQRTRPDFKLMIPIYEEPVHYLDDSFDRMERDVISKFRGGIKHPASGKTLLHCDNGAEGASPKCYLYILVGLPGWTNP